jgi:hypothetical protein
MASGRCRSEPGAEIHTPPLELAGRLCGVDRLDRHYREALIGEVGAYDHSASTRILAAFTAASRRSFFRCGANALRSLC